MHSQHHIVVSVSFWAEGLEQCLIHSRITEFGRIGSSENLK